MRHRSLDPVSQSPIGAQCNDTSVYSVVIAGNRMRKQMASAQRIRVLLIQQFFPAYRVPVFCRLAEHPQIELTLIHGTSAGVAPGEIGLVNITKDMPFKVLCGPIPRLGLGARQLLWFGLAVKTVRTRNFDVVIHNFATRWASLGRIRRIQQNKGGKFILWGIGFSQTRTPILDSLRKRMLQNADAGILYCNRDRRRYVGMGAKPSKLFVARNSIDFGPIDQAVSEWPKDDQRQSFLPSGDS